jgi:dUTP pyrophosphatase
MMIQTGVVLQIPGDCYARIAPRSGLALKHGIDVLAGVVDSNYRNTIQVILQNHGQQAFKVKVGDRIAQLIFERIYLPETIEQVLIDELSETTRGENGLGSSGV